MRTNRRTDRTSLARTIAVVLALTALLACAGGCRQRELEEPTWQTYRDPGGRFSADFPGAPERDTLEGEQRVMLNFTWSIRTYFVTFRELAGDVAKADPGRVIEAKADKSIKGRGLKGARKRAVEVAGRPAVELEAPTSQGVFHARIVLDRPRLYEVWTITEGAGKGEPLRFIRSFRPLP